METDARIKNIMLEYYDSHPDYYTSLDLIAHEGEGGMDLKRIIGLILDNNARRILDVGFGSGRMLTLVALELHKRGYEAECYGIDVSKNAVNVAEERIKNLGVNAKFLQADAEGSLEFEDGFFDLVYSTYVLEHIVNPEAMMKNAIRVLKPKGVLYMTFPGTFHCYTSPFSRRNVPTTLKLLKIYDIIRMIFDGSYLRFRMTTPKLEGVCDDTDLVFLTSLPEIVRFLERNGMDVVDYDMEGYVTAIKRKKVGKDSARPLKYAVQFVFFSGRLLRNAIFGPPKARSCL